MINTQQLTANHWNYFLAIEEDLKHISRFIEFTPDNFDTYSIELAHLLLTASSEIDVLLKQICSLLEPDSKMTNIDNYREIFKKDYQSYIFEGFIKEKFYLPRYNLEFIPWTSWKNDKNPNWWHSYNNVKHHRNSCFPEANLKNVINAVGALLIVEIYYYWFSNQIEKIKNIKEIDAENTRIEIIWNLKPNSTFVILEGSYYPKVLGF